MKTLATKSSIDVCVCVCTRSRNVYLYFNSHIYIYISKLGNRPSESGDSAEHWAFPLRTHSDTQFGFSFKSSIIKLYLVMAIVFSYFIM